VIIIVIITIRRGGALATNISASQLKFLVAPLTIEWNYQNYIKTPWNILRHWHFLQFYFCFQHLRCPSAINFKLCPQNYFANTSEIILADAHVALSPVCQFHYYAEQRLFCCGHDVMEWPPSCAALLSRTLSESFYNHLKTILFDRAGVGSTSE